MMKLKIEKVFFENKENFISFNSSIYSTRLSAIEQAQYKFNLSPQLSFVATDNNKVVGQIILYPASFFYLNNKENCVFAYDYIVHPEYLNTGIGVKLLSKTIKEYIHFGIGLSDISRKLHLVLKEKPVGNIHKYLFTKNLLTYFYAGFKTYLKFSVRKMPSKIFWQPSVEFNSFTGVKTNSLPSYIRPWNDDLIEFGRDKEFLELRFERFISKYAYYQIFDYQQKLHGYFILRVELWRGMRVIIVSDYRVKKDNNKAFDLIIFVTKKLMKQNRLDAVLFGSSLKIIDDRLIANNFKKVGLPSEIFTNLPLESGWESKAVERNLIFATPADSDFEFNLGNELWKK